ncbi:MAG: alpha/beta hydrolase [Candidatus Competibacteraceae bacterium]|nr:alpha/beta hydrolase [Candidatus Competibacteraceae bacterium]
MRNFIVKLFFRITKFVLYRHDYTPDKYRKGMDFFTWFLPKPKGVTYEHERVGNMDALWIKPKNIDNDSVILYLHGGGYGMGSIRSHKKLCGRIARSCKSQSLIIEYRLAPEHPFPAALHDAYYAYSWLLAKGFRPEKIVIGGDSAGGGLTISTLLYIREKKIQQPLAAFCLSPWLDLSASSQEMDMYQKNDPFIDKKSIEIWGKRYAGNDLKNPLASPINAQLHQLAPMIVQIGTAEILLFENRAFHQKAIGEKIDFTYHEYPDMVHVFQTFGGFLPQADMAIKEIGDFILKQAACYRQNQKETTE